MTTTTTKPDLKANAQSLTADLEALKADLGTALSTPTQPPRVMLAFLMGLSVGLSLGAAGVAIAWGLS